MELGKKNDLSDKIKSKVILNGGNFNVRLEGSNHLLNIDTESLLGKEHNILSANNGISGQFDKLNTHYKFIDISLFCQPIHPHPIWPPRACARR